MRHRYAPLLLSLAMHAACAATPAEPALRTELLAMQQADQDSRQGGHPTVDVDGRHLRRLQHIVARYGWPDSAMVGADGSQAAALLALHADRDLGFQRRVLALMAPLVAQGRVAPKDYAYLYDRTHGPQRYGTQGWCIDRTTWQPFEIADPDGLAERRRQAGMVPLADYVASMAPACAHTHVAGDAALRDRAAQLSEGVDVTVVRDEIRVAGQTVATPEALLALLAERHILKIRLYTDIPASSYQRIGQIIYGTQRAGILLSSVEDLPPQ